VLEKLKRLDPDVESVKLDLSKGDVLEKGRIYVIPLLETVNLRTSELTAFSNPKSLRGVSTFSRDSLRIGRRTLIS